MNGSLIAVGQVLEEFNLYLPQKIPPGIIYQSSGLKKHIQKRHPECLEYMDLIPFIIASPDYIGVNPNETSVSFELVKVLSENIQIGVKLDAKENYLYVATLHTITPVSLE